MIYEITTRDARCYDFRYEVTADSLESALWEVWEDILLDDEQVTAVKARRADGEIWQLVNPMMVGRAIMRVVRRPDPA